MSNRSVAEAVAVAEADGGDGGGSGDEAVPFDDDSHNVAAAAVVAWLYKTMPMRSLTSAVC